MDRLPSLLFSQTDVPLHGSDHLVIDVDIVPVAFEFFQVLGLHLFNLFQRSQTVLVFFSNIFFLLLDLVYSDFSLGDRVNDGSFHLPHCSQFIVSNRDI